MGNEITQDILCDCEKLLGFARSNLAAMTDSQGSLLADLYARESRKAVQAALSSLVDNLARCRGVEDLPGAHPTVIALRDATFEVLARMFKIVGDPLTMSYHFLEGARDFFDLLISRNPTLIRLVKVSSLSHLSKVGLLAAMRICHFQLTGRQWVTGFLKSRYLEDYSPSDEDLGDPTKKRRVRETIWTRRQNEAVLALAAERGVKPSLVVREVWRAHAAEYTAASFLDAKYRGYKSEGSLRSHFACS